MTRILIIFTTEMQPEIRERFLHSFREIAAISFSIPASSFEFWKTRLTKKNIIFSSLSRFNEEVLILEDHDGFKLEIVASEEETRLGWKPGNVPEELPKIKTPTN
jgi:hypothetical protein